MEKLSELPTKNDGEVKLEDAQLMEKYFPQAENTKGKGLSWTQIFKLTLFAVLIFLAVSNPITAKAIVYLPYMSEDSVLAPIAFQVVVFVIVFVLCQKFLL